MKPYSVEITLGLSREELEKAAVSPVERLKACGKLFTMEARRVEAMSKMPSAQPYWDFYRCRIREWEQRAVQCLSEAEALEARPSWE